MRRTALLAACTLTFAPVAAHAVIDLRCSNSTFTSAVSGLVQDALGTPLSGLTVETSQTNRQLTLDGPVLTDATGAYLICAGNDQGPRHGTFDVHVRDLRGFPFFAGASQPYTTMLSPVQPADFTPASGSPLRYLLSLEITPDAVNPGTGPVVSWRIRSKAPAATTMTLDRSHLGTTVTVPFTGTEAGGPASGGWNVWTATLPIPPASLDGLHNASARGFSGTTQITEEDTEFYVFDSVAPMLGSALPQSNQCGAGVVADPISPLSPPGTTNRRPIVQLGACDLWNNGARSGIDPYGITGQICLDPDLTIGCTPTRPYLSTRTLVWFPDTPLAIGTYYLQWIIRDKAGNQSLNVTGYPLSIVDRGGQVPVIVSPNPGDFQSGNTSGVIIGSSVTSPNSYPYVGFRVLDADGQQDLLPGTLRVRVFYLDDRQLVYEYDELLAPNAYDAVTKAGGATFDLSSGLFRATGFPLQGKPPGRYSVTASVVDRGGNFSTMSWHFVLAAAI